MKGHKRHIVVDTLGNLLHVEVHAANLSDTVGGCEVLRRTAAKHPSLDAFSGDAGYRGTAVGFVSEVLGLTLHFSEKIADGFAVLAKRWIVERTFAWLGNFSRLSKDFETLTATAENMIRIAMLKITLLGANKLSAVVALICPVSLSTCFKSPTEIASSGNLSAFSPWSGNVTTPRRSATQPT